MHYAKTASKLRELILRFSGELSAGLPKPGRRFVGEMLYGLQARQSVRLTEIGRALGELTDIQADMVIDYLKQWAAYHDEIKSKAAKSGGGNGAQKAAQARA